MLTSGEWISPPTGQCWDLQYPYVVIVWVVLTLPIKSSHSTTVESVFHLFILSFLSVMLLFQSICLLLSICIFFWRTNALIFVISFSDSSFMCCCFTAYWLVSVTAEFIGSDSFYSGVFTVFSYDYISETDYFVFPFPIFLMLPFLFIFLHHCLVRTLVMLNRIPVMLPVSTQRESFCLQFYWYICCGIFHIQLFWLWRSFISTCWVL